MMMKLSYKVISIIFFGSLVDCLL